MLVDDKQAREKMARICDEEAGRWVRNKHAALGASHCAAAIRQTDLSDCKVEVDFLEAAHNWQLKAESLSAQVAALTEKLENLREATSTKRLLQLSNQYDGQILRAAAAEAQVAELQATLKERGLWYAGREAHILNARDAHQQRADRAEAQVEALKKDAK